MNKIKVLITGATGQLGMELMELLQNERKYEYFGMGKKSLDVTNFVSVKQVVNDIKPGVILHLAAYTHVDASEQNPDQAYLINAYGTRNVAVAAQEINAKLIYVSTDYVFNGTTHSAYHELDTISPVSIYGKSKAAGEDFVRNLHLRHFIVRTSWLYGKHGTNFVKKILNVSEEKEEIFVVSDQIGSPTYSLDLCHFLLNLMNTEKYGTYHFSNSGHCSWYEFAQTIIQFSGMTVKVIANKTDKLAYPAPRPTYSVFEHQAIRLNGFKKPRMWREALKDFMDDRIEKPEE
ncbi:dTDP-4-dehydrorhamnose reductase [Bacillus sp. FSL K6-3431]|uniref:dTDP-4-dehydrorhamnose reductase n=1 Tax=Bacillus sp. FSL K6-3431 TaxID=2921500 RepID=UPI0030FB13AB